MVQRLRQVSALWALGRTCWTITLLACLFAATAAAQITTGSMSGTVRDATGAVVAKADVKLTNQSTGDSRFTQSNSAGYFSFAALIPDSYTVRVEAPGFKVWKQNGLVLNAGDERTIANIELAVGATTETVEVQSASAALVPTDNGERAALLDYRDIQKLTVQGRELSELVKVLPGVTTVAGATGNTAGFNFTLMGAAGSAIGVGLSPNGAPYRGGTAYILDGANIIDPGVDAWSIASVNPDMTQEVKIQTSNFGADNADGPAIVNVISKSGSSQYHGGAYFYARNGVLNSNQWTNNHTGTKRTADEYYYPGGNFGGPVRLPHSDFNKNNKLLFWGGYEYQWQNPGSSTILESTIPGADMQKGNFTLNNTSDSSPLDSNAALCPSGFGPNNRDWCNDLSGGYGADGTAITNPGAIPVDAGTKALMSLWPKPNVDPSKNSGYNYYLAIGGQQNVYIYRFRVDYNINENNKVFVSYQQGHDSIPIPAHIWWNPSNSIPYPGGGITQPTTSRVLAANLVTIITPTLTNEFVGAWGWIDEPFSPNNVKASWDTTVGYPYGTVYNGSKLVPGINGLWPYTNTFPDTSMPDIWTSGGGVYPTKKATPSFSDNVTKVYKTHTFKFGAFTELVNNDQGSYNNFNGVFSFGTAIQADPLNSAAAQIGTNNPTANLMMGIASSFTQTNSNPLTNMAFRTVAVYEMDNWKVFSRLMVNLGWRFDHLGRWYDRAGNGMAVWLPGNYQNDLAQGKSYPGVSWHGISPGIPNSGSPVRTAFTSPRLGLAYDLFGKGKTVIRGGWGEYRWNDQYNDYGGPLTTAALMQTYNAPSGNITLADIGRVGSGSSTTGSIAGGVSVADPNDFENAATEAYNFTISQQLPWATLLEVAYVGNNTKNLLMGGQSAGTAIAGSGGNAYTNQNKVPIGGVFQPDPVTGAAAPADPDNTGSYNLTDYYPYYQGYGQNAVTMLTHNGYSNYNGLQISWIKQSGNLTFDLNYTWSKSLGIVNTSVDPFTVHGNYGVLNIDRPHVINTSYSYALGTRYHGDSKIVSGAANGWNVSGTTTWQAGGNEQALNGQNLGLSIADSATGTNVTTLSYYGTNVGDIQPVLTCNPKSGFTHSNQLLNPLCFAPPALGHYGPRQYGYLGGPSYFNSDLTVFKNFHITEKQAVEFRAAMFNFLNHPLRQFTTATTFTPTFTTTDKVNFTSTLVQNLKPALQPYVGTPDQKQGYRLGELSVKYSF